LAIGWRGGAVPPFRHKLSGLPHQTSVHFQPFFSPWGQRALSQAGLSYIKHGTSITTQNTI